MQGVTSDGATFSWVMEETPGRRQLWPKDLEFCGYCFSVTKSCLTLCNSMDCSPPGCSVHGILQARILAWVAISFSRASSQCRDQTQVSQVSGIGRWILYQWWERKYHTENHSLHFQADSTSITAVKDYCIFSSLKHHKFIILELPGFQQWSRGLKSRCQQAAFSISLSLIAPGDLFILTGCRIQFPEDVGLRSCFPTCHQRRPFSALCGRLHPPAHLHILHLKNISAGQVPLMMHLLDFLALEGCSAWIPSTHLI